MKKLFIVLIGIGLIAACNNEDDDGTGVISVPPRLLSEVASENDEEIQEFLQTHFYNYEDFEEPIDSDFDFRVVIDTIAGENSDKTPLSQQAESLVLTVSSEQFNSEDEEDVPHTLYYVEVREGSGDSPTVADSTLIKYEASLLDNTRFDAVSDFFWQELPFFIRGFATGAATIKAGTTDGLVSNPDGTTQITDSGIGLIFMPSGLAYFNNPPSPPIEAYDPLVFSVEVGLFIEGTDNDNDGIPSIMEDINGDLNVFNDNSDFDIEQEQGLLLEIPDFRDVDDDGDGVLTRTEISDAEGNIIFPYPITGGGSVPDYLNPDVQRDPNN